MKLFILHFDTHGDLTRAFDKILESVDVISCVIESEDRGIRFHAPEAPAEKLIERIYMDGGLTWCARVPLVGHDADRTAPRSA